MPTVSRQRHAARRRCPSARRCSRATCSARLSVRPPGSLAGDRRALRVTSFWMSSRPRRRDRIAKPSFVVGNSRSTPSVWFSRSNDRFVRSCFAPPRKSMTLYASVRAGRSWSCSRCRADSVFDLFSSTSTRTGSVTSRGSGDGGASPRRSVRLGRHRRRDRRRRLDLRRDERRARVRAGVGLGVDADLDAREVAAVGELLLEVEQLLLRVQLAEVDRVEVADGLRRIALQPADLHRTEAHRRPARDDDRQLRLRRAHVDLRLAARERRERIGPDQQPLQQAPLVGFPLAWRKTSPATSVQSCRSTSCSSGGSPAGACSDRPANCRSTDSTVVTAFGSMR